MSIPHLIPNLKCHSRTFLTALIFEFSSSPSYYHDHYDYYYHSYHRPLIINTIINPVALHALLKKPPNEKVVSHFFIQELYPRTSLIAFPCQRTLKIQHFHHHSSLYCIYSLLVSTR
jgi:hypothetical protein